MKASQPSRTVPGLGGLDLAERLATRLLPSSLAPAIHQARLDVATLLGALSGHRPPVLVPRKARGPRRIDPHPGPRPAAEGVSAGVSGVRTRPMRVVRVVRETADAVTLVLEDESGAAVAFLPGQFFTVWVRVDGQVLRRAYSASCPPGAEGASRVALTVKRVPGGRVSNLLNDSAREGLRLEVLGPSGRFTPEPSQGRPRHLVLLAGGSGITPLMSIARTVLAHESTTRVSLVFGNRREADILFRDALEALARALPGRLTLRHVLSEPPAGWASGVGLLDSPRLEAELAALHLPEGEPVLYFLCGPEPMMRAARATLLARGVPAESIREERFTQPPLRADAPEAPTGPQPVEVRLRGEARRLTVPEGHTVLEAGLAAGLALPYSCTLGGCGACKVVLREGQVRMEEPHCLAAAERARGEVLACVARPLSPLVVEVP